MKISNRGESELTGITKNGEESASESDVLGGASSNCYKSEGGGRSTGEERGIMRWGGTSTLRKRESKDQNPRRNS